MRHWTKTLEVITNFALLVVCLLVVGLYVRSRLGNSQPQVASHKPPIGVTLNVSGVDWSNSQHTLVMALSTNCHFCTDSAPFYRKLTEIAKQQHARVIAILPQPVAESTLYVAQRGFSVDDVRQLPLNDIHVEGTPTLLLVDSTGRVTTGWVGKLTSKLETEVISSISAKR